MAVRLVLPNVTKEFKEDLEACSKALMLVMTVQVWEPKNDTEEAKRNCGLWKGR